MPDGFAVAAVDVDALQHCFNRAESDVSERHPRERGSGMHDRGAPRAWWLAPVVIVILLSYVVPFGLLRDVDAWYGSMLFWILGTAVVIAVNAVVSSAWRD